MSANEGAPVIIKRVKKVSGDGHHGGAWKVAYADFVTAMMAFFLLMWLLNATTEQQRKGIADYFNPTIPINRISGGGEGAFGGDSIFSEDMQVRNGTGATSNANSDQLLARGETGTDMSDQEAAAEEIEMRGLEEMLTGRAGESMASDDIARHIVTKVTDEGLIVELHDLPDAPLFAPNTTDPLPVMVELVDLVASIFVLAVNEVAVNGFTQAEPIVVADSPVWDLSSGRAEVVRQMLEAGALPEGRTQRVTGFADRKPAAQDPLSYRNNRIEIILLREVR
ncbi:MAG: flagellar motor protein MotB [Pseudomonadota bacterium]